MAAVEITFIVLSIILLLYLLQVLFLRNRIPLAIELAYLLMYVVSLIFFFFPRTWQWINSSVGVQLLINLFLILAVFSLFSICVRFYQKLELLRREITNVVREHALLSEQNSKPKKK